MRTNGEPPPIAAVVIVAVSCTAGIVWLAFLIQALIAQM